MMTSKENNSVVGRFKRIALPLVLIPLMLTTCLEIKSDEAPEQTIEELIVALQEKIDARTGLTDQETQSLFDLVYSLEGITDSIKTIAISEEAIQFLEKEYIRQLQAYNERTLEYNLATSTDSVDAERMEEMYFLVTTDFKLLSMVHSQLKEYMQVIGATSVPKLPELPAKTTTL